MAQSSLLPLWTSIISICLVRPYPRAEDPPALSKLQRDSVRLAQALLDWPLNGSKDQLNLRTASWTSKILGNWLTCKSQDKICNVERNYHFVIWRFTSTQFLTSQMRAAVSKKIAWSEKLPTFSRKCALAVYMLSAQLVPYVRAVLHSSVTKYLWQPMTDLSTIALLSFLWTASQFLTFSGFVYWDCNKPQQFWAVICTLGRFFPAVTKMGGILSIFLRYLCLS